MNIEKVFFWDGNYGTLPRHVILQIDADSSLNNLKMLQNNNVAARTKTGTKMAVFMFDS